MGDELQGKHPPMEGTTAGAQIAAPLGSHSLGCSPEHGIREGASADGDDSRDTRPDRATRYVETSLGILSYSELAPASWKLHDWGFLTGWAVSSFWELR